MDLRRILRISLAVGVVTGLPLTVEAAPITYTTVFDGSSVGPSGTGSFVWDATTNTLSSFEWDFGAGQTGAFDNLLSGDNSFLIDNVFGIDPDPLSGGSSTGYAGGFGGWTGSFPSDLAGASLTFCSGSLNFFNCGMPVNGTSYRFIDSSGAVIARGFASASAASVPEPSTLLLLGTGLIGVGVRRNRRRS